MPTTLTVTEVSTMFVVGPSDRNDQGQPPITSLPYPAVLATGDDGLILPTPTLPITMSSTPYINPGPYVDISTPPIGKLPNEDYIVRTILHSNMTIIHNRVEDFKRQMEVKLGRAYKKAYDKNKLHARWTRSAPAEEEQEMDMLFPHGRQLRSEKNQERLFQQEEHRAAKGSRGKRHRTPPRVMIHNIRSALPEPEIEVLYTVYQGM